MFDEGLPSPLRGRPDVHTATLQPTLDGWMPIHTAPRNGTLVDLTWMVDGEPQEIWPMRWEPAATNPLFPGVKGLWVLDGGGATWTEHDPDGAPSHWRSRTVH